MNTVVAEEKAKKSTRAQNAEFRLNFLIEETDGVHVGWCIETGNVATGVDAKSCIRALVELTCEHISFALENDNPADIFNSAPRDVVNKFIAIAQTQTPNKCQEDNEAERRSCGPLFSVHPAVYAAARL